MFRILPWAQYMSSKQDEIEHEIDEELRFHIEMRTRANVAVGMAPEEAKEAALLRFGDYERIKQCCYEIQSSTFFNRASPFAWMLTGLVLTFWTMSGNYHNLRSMLCLLVGIVIMLRSYLKVRRVSPNTILKRMAFALFVSLAAMSVFAYTSHQQANPGLTRSELAQQVFDRYIRALGGREAYVRITSRSLKGTFEYVGSLQRTPGSFETQHATGKVEMHWKAPNKFTEVLLGGPLGAIRRGYNGKDAWGFHPQAGVRKVSAAEVTEILREGALYQPLSLSEHYTQMSFDSKRRVDGPEVDIVDATTKDNRTERFYFDSATRLPVRLDLWEEGPEGERTGGEYYLAQFYLGDYRIVNGIQVPFSIRRVRPHSTMILTFTEVRQNIALDDSIFEAPRQSSK